MNNLNLPPVWRRPWALLGAFFLVFVACALLGQAISHIPASEEGAPIEAFTSGLLWLIAMFGLTRASASLQTQKNLLFWLALTAATGALAVDEVVGMHERTEPVINDDWIKVVMWIATPFVLRHIARIERAPGMIWIVMIVGYVFHTGYMIVEAGDGEIFSLPVAQITLKTLEELFELLFLVSYTYALWLLALYPQPEAKRPDSAGA